MAEKTLTGFAARLVGRQLIDEKVLRQAISSSKERGVSLSSWLISEDLVSSTDVAIATSEEFGMPLFDIDSLDIENCPRELISEQLMRQHRLIPLSKRGGRLFVGTSNPGNHTAIDELRFSTGLVVDQVIVEEDKAERLIDRLLNSGDAVITGMDDQDLANLEDLEIESVKESSEEEVNTDDDTPIVRFVNKMLLSAIKSGSSDLHFEPYEKTYRVRFRTDGVLHEAAAPPIALAPRVASRLKIMSAMDISERRKPQDGRIKMRISKTKSIDFRVNTLPTLWGEKIVLRVLDSSSAEMGIDALGYEDEQKALYLETLNQPQGMILVTGPTGSGKTVSLYTGLNILNTPERNISTVEDPVEINLEGINQVNVNLKQGLDFSEALRAFLRQDPDIIMVGEIRDLETASIATKAAQTGHLVLSTLHTNSAAETLTRLQNMGVPPFNIATSVSLIIAQRLARRLCSHCKREANIPEEALLEEGFSKGQAERAVIFEPVGCDRCNKGYKGRIGIYEVVKMTPAMQQIIMQAGNSLEIARTAQNDGFQNLRQSGLLKVLSGVTSLEEVNRVTLD